jgi:signal-transduction protein with cAMP-binding, CBS, and nucleotidyltransferase domain
MAELNIGALPVVDDGRLVGIFSERDVLRRIVGRGMDLNSIPVSEVMTSDPVSSPPSLRVFEAMRVMSDRKFRHLPVVDGNRLIGMVSMGDVTARVISEQSDSIRSMVRAVGRLTRKQRSTPSERVFPLPPRRHNNAHET